MVFGSYPCCGGDLAIPVPDRTPAYRPEACPHCGVKVWHRVSRLDPVTWTEAEFLALYDVDAAAGIVTERNPAPPIPPEVAAAFVRVMEDLILYGDSTIKNPTGLLSGMNS